MLLSTCIFENIYSLYILRTTLAGCKVPGTLCFPQTFGAFCFSALMKTWDHPDLFPHYTWLDFSAWMPIFLYLLNQGDFSSIWIFKVWFAQFSLSAMSIIHMQDFFSCLFLIISIPFYYFPFFPPSSLFSLCLVYFVFWVRSNAGSQISIVKFWICL